MSRVLDTFLELVRIDSPSQEEAACARHVADALTSLGLDVWFDGSTVETGSDTGNLIARLPATAPGKAILLSAHLDTVMPGRGIVPVVEDGVVRPQGDTVLGGDDKSGVAAILEALRRCVESGEEHGDLLVVLTTCEEQGLRGAKALDPAVLAGTDIAFVLDAAGSPGGIVEGAPTHYTFTAEFRGRAAHAGVEPENGVSAIRMAADAVAAMRLGRLDEMTTANIGTISGGTATNVIASSCVVTGECRSLVRDTVEQVREQMDAAMHTAADRLGGSVGVAWVKEYDGYLFSPEDPTISLVEAACRDAGVEPVRFRTGGGSDGNVFAGHGVPTVVLSSGMTDVHSVGESLKVEDLELLTEIVTALIRRAAG